MGYMRNAYKVLVGKPERKKTFVKPRHRWEYVIEILVDVRGIECGGMRFI
jgi:hypothetical protein